MSTTNPTDLLLVNRGDSSYSVQIQNMSTLQDTDLLLVNRNGASYKIEAKDLNIAAPVPVIGSATLSEVDPTGDRYTSQSFYVGITMTEDGNPPSTKQLKGYVEGTLKKHAETDVITDVVSATTGEWTPVTSVTSGAWQGVAYGDGKFVAVGDSASPSVMHSTDALTWVDGVSPGSGWKDITYGDDMFVAVGENDGAMYSTDGISWTLGTGMNSNYGWTSVAYGDGVWVAVCLQGTVAYSTNGTFWNAASAAEGNQWMSVTHGNGLFVAVSANGAKKVMYSSDGISWTSSNTAPYDNLWTSVTYGDGIFTAVAKSGTSTLAMYSPDAVGWNLGNVSNDPWQSVTYGGNKFVLVANSNTVNARYSTDGIMWNTTDGSFPPSAWSAVTYGDGKFVAVSAGAPYRVMYSTTGSGEVNANTLTFATDKDLADFSVGDAVSSDPAGATGTVTSVDAGNKQMVIGPYTGTWTANTGMKAKGDVEVDVSKLWVMLSPSGQVLSLVGEDPGYTTMAGNPTYQLTFPSMFPSGDAPDTDLPAGTSFTVDVKAGNTEGTSYKTTNTVVPGSSSGVFYTDSPSDVIAFNRIKTAHHAYEQKKDDRIADINSYLAAGGYSFTTDPYMHICDDES